MAEEKKAELEPTTGIHERLHLIDVTHARSGLPKKVCAILLMRGWSYVQEVGKPDRWEKVIK